MRRIAAVALAVAFAVSACNSSDETSRLRRMVTRSAEEWRQLACDDLGASYAIDIPDRSDLQKQSFARLLEAERAATNAAELDPRYSKLARDTADLVKAGKPQPHVTTAFFEAHRLDCPQPRS